MLNNIMYAEKILYKPIRVSAGTKTSSSVQLWKKVGNWSVLGQCLLVGQAWHALDGAVLWLGSDATSKEDSGAGVINGIVAGVNVSRDDRKPITSP